MDEFSIHFTDEVRVHEDERYALGIIRIADFEEYFESSLFHWSTRQYEQSWRIALQRIVGGESVSCLITDFHDPQWANFIITWPLYRIGGEVCIQNQLLFLDELKAPFVTERPWESMDPRESIDEDGNKISEWFVPVSAVEDFLNGE